MANIKIAQLTAKTTVSDADILIIEDGTQTYKITFANLMEALKKQKKLVWFATEETW